MTTAATKGDDAAESVMQINAHIKDKIIPIIVSSDNNFMSTSWGTICQKFVENSFTVDSKLVLQMLIELSPKERFTNYLIRYGDDNATIFCVDWSSADISGYARVPLEEGYIEANMTLEPRKGGPLQSVAKPHLPLQPVEMEDPPSSVDVDLRINKLVPKHSSNGVAAIDHATTHTAFPSSASRTSVVYLQEHDSFPGSVRLFKTVPMGSKNHRPPGTDSSSATAALGTKHDTPPVIAETASSSTQSKSKSSKKKKKRKDRSKSNDDKIESGTQSPDKKTNTSRKDDVKNPRLVDCTSGAAITEKSHDLLDDSDKGGLKSIVDPYFSQNYPGVMDAGFRVLDYLYLYPSHAPWVEGAGLLLAAESCYGNDPMINLQRSHYLRQSFAKTDLSSIPVDDNTRVCFVYGAGYGSVTFGTVEEQMAYREWTADMQIIADAIEKELVNKFSTDLSVDVNVHLNELEVVSFYSSKRITFHRDQSYSPEGEFCSNNCQKQHTCTCIFVLGDDRVLEFQLFLGKKKVNHPEAQKMIRLTNGALFFLHPKDEEDCLRQMFQMNNQTHFKHRNNGVKEKGVQLSIGLVFRTCVQTRTVYKGTGQLVLDSEPTETTHRCKRKLNAYEKCWTKNLMDECLKKKYLSTKERHYR